MKKLLLLAALVACAFTVSSLSEAKAGCRSGFYGGYSYAPAYSYGYAPAYSNGYAPAYSYSAPVYNYGPVNSWGYAYPSAGFYYGRPGVGLSIGSGYGYGGYGYGGYGHHHRRW